MGQKMSKQDLEEMALDYCRSKEKIKKIEENMEALKAVLRLNDGFETSKVRIKVTENSKVEKMISLSDALKMGISKEELKAKNFVKECDSGERLLVTAKA